MTQPKRGHGAKFPRQWERAIEALLTQPTIGKAATKCGVSRRTLERWVRDVAFARSYQAAKTELLQGAVNKLRLSATEFVATLSTIAKNRRNPAASRVSAASRGLEILLKAGEVEDIRQRLDALERDLETGDA